MNHIAAVLKEEYSHKMREHKLAMGAVALFSTAPNLVIPLSLRHLTTRPMHRLRFIQSHADILLPQGSAIAHHRHQLGTHSLVALLDSMLVVARKAQISPDPLSAGPALRRVQDVMPEFQLVAHYQLRHFFHRFLMDTAPERSRKRRNRNDHRIVKHKMTSLRLERPDHYHWPQPTYPFSPAIALIGKVLSVGGS
jgi:hypothetical protein